MKYILSAEQANQHFLEVSFTVEKVVDSQMIFLPTWRPGRYQIANFAKNVRNFVARDAAGKLLTVEKVKNNGWKVFGNGQVTISYEYYAAEINGGSTYIDEQHLYVNPVNCFMWVDASDSCEVVLPMIDGAKYAGQLELDGQTLKAVDFDELADSPFIYSTNLQSKSFVVDEVEHRVWFNGEVKPDWDRLITDFTKYTKEQMNIFGHFPSKTYDYLIQILPYKTYHGVEHSRSTVLSLGPSYAIFGGDMYDELLGVSCHELFHTWNIKSIRPIEMMPYDFEKENYSELGYVAEGVTTYYGDYLLFRSGVFNQKKWFGLFAEWYTRHAHNLGRFNNSLAVSSEETWLDGYEKGVSERKMSIYSDGAMLAFITDVGIRKHSNNEHSLDDVMKALYEEFGRPKIGYSVDDYWKMVARFGGQAVADKSRTLVETKSDYLPHINEALEHVGLTATGSKDNFASTSVGVKLLGNKVFNVHPESNAYKAGLAVGDELIHVNGYSVNNDAAEWLEYFGSEAKIVVKCRITGQLKSLTISYGGEQKYYERYTIKTLENSNLDDNKAYQNWAGKNIK